MAEINLLKEKVVHHIDELKDELLTVSHTIFHQPELSFHEYKAAKVLGDKLAEKKFTVQQGICNLATAFSGTYGEGKPTIAFLAEYDALPELGHACGHNIIGTAALGAAFGVSKILNGITGTIKVLGTPAEENGGGKVIMLNHHGFDGIDVALLTHPAGVSRAEDVSFASRKIEYVFHGKSAHAAAAPWVGASALNAVIQLFNLTNSMRLHVKDYARIHGIITEGGTATNVIPDRAAAAFSLRALDGEYLDQLIQLVNRCAQGAAIATGTTFEIKSADLGCQELNNNPVLVRLMNNNFALLGEQVAAKDASQSIGSTDMGNVTHVLPAIHAAIGLKKGISTHTPEFAKHAGSEAGDKALITAAKAMALVAVDILAQPGILSEINQYF